MMQLLQALFAASVVSGLIIGFEIVYGLSHFFKHGWDMFRPSQIKAKRLHVNWLDVAIGAFLLSVAFGTPSIAIPVSTAGLVTRVYIRMQMQCDNSLFGKIGNFLKGALSQLNSAITGWTEEASASYRKGRGLPPKRKARKASPKKARKTARA